MVVLLRFTIILCPLVNKSKISFTILKKFAFSLGFEPKVIVRRFFFFQSTIYDDIPGLGAGSGGPGAAAVTEAAEDMAAAAAVDAAASDEATAVAMVELAEAYKVSANL